MPNRGSNYTYTLRFINLKSPIIFSELDVCEEVCGFILSVASSLDPYYSRDTRHKTHPTQAIGLFVDKMKAIVHPFPYMYNSPDLE
jgi:hypothetical protein